MTWIKQNEELYIHNIAPFSLIKINGEWFVTDSRDQSKAVPYNDIFNNPVYNIDFSDKTLLAKHFRAEGVNTPGTPGFSFQGDSNLGLYRIDEDRLGFAANGIRQGEFGVGYGGFTGNIIQVVQGSSATRFSTASTSWITFSDGVSITPKYINSKFIVIYTISVVASGVNMGMDFARKIGSGAIVQNISGKSYGIVSHASTSWTVACLCYLDSPTLSNLDPITYYLSCKTSGGTVQTVNFGTGNEFDPIIIAEVQQ